MDAVRFGRALGSGARQAAKTVVTAVDAARAENPSKPKQDTAGVKVPPPAHAALVAATARPEATTHASSTPPSSVPAAIPAASQGAAAIAARGVEQARGVRRGWGRFRDSAVEPFIRLSGVLWLEITGVFFGIFAVSAAAAAWRLRAQWHPAIADPHAHRSLIGAAIIFVLFGYFSVSSFVRARRRERRKG